MARIEFYTMALLTMPLLAFGVSKKFSFLSDKTIGAMFNLGIKLAVISFLTGAICPMLNTFTESFNSNGTKGIPGGDLRVCLVMLITVLIIYLLTKKIPQLVSGLLSGQPQLGGSQMTQMAASAARTAGAAAGVVRGASMAAKAGGAQGIGQMTMGTLRNLGAGGVNAMLHRNPVAQGHQAGVTAMIGNDPGKIGGLLSSYAADNKIGRTLDKLGHLSPGKADSQLSKMASRNFKPKTDSKPPDEPPPPPGGSGGGSGPKPSGGENDRNF